MFKWIKTWADKNQTRRALNQMNDRELRDIGLCRGDIENVVNGNSTAH